MMRQLNTLRFRLVLWSMLVNAVLLLGLGAGLWWGLRQLDSNQIDNTLQLSAAQLSAAVDMVDGRLGVPIDDAATLINRGVFAWVVNSSGELDTTLGRAAKLPLPVLEQNMQELPLDNNSTMRVYQYPLHENNAMLIVGMSLEQMEQTSHAVLVILAIAIPSALMISSAGAAFLAGRALAPIAAITAQARRISRENLSERLSLSGPDDEVGQLAQTLDDMLDRLQAAFEHERQFIADASHELRTPLSLLKAQLSLALNRPRDTATLVEMMQAMEGDVDRMTRLVETMLILMRTEAAQIRTMPVDIQDLLKGLVHQWRPIAAQRNIALTLDCPSGALVYGDGDLLLRLFFNLLDNAVKYSAVDGRVQITVVPLNGKWQIDVVDNGVGIAAEHLPRLFDRFYRADSSRARETGGVGLGLAIAQAITRQYGGTISVQSQAGQGSTFSVILPSYDRPTIENGHS